jgi:6-phosphogluconolactonase (cycloisomerase 2 family)
MRTLLAVLVTLAVAATALAAAVPRGSLTQPPATAGCFVDPTQHAAQQGCAKAVGLSSTQNVVLSPDQRNLYATSNWTWGLDVFARSTKTGLVRQLQCLSSMPTTGCTTARGMVFAFWTAVSSDGDNVYVSGGKGNAIAVLHRNPATGRVTQLAGQDGCLQNTTGAPPPGAPTAQASGCRLVDGLLYPRSIALDPSGLFLYAASFSGDQLTAFARDPSTGALTQAPGISASSKAKTTCAKASALDGVTDLTVSRDGRFLYAASFDADGVDAFARDPTTGALTEVGCVTQSATAGCTTGRGLSGAYNLALSRDGRSLYVVSRHSAAIAVFDRDPQTGAITQKPGAAGCIAAKATSGCGGARGLIGVRGVTVSADGHSVYTGAFSDSAIAVFARTASGALHQLPGRSGCVAETLAGCTRGRGIRQAWAVTTSADGKFLYTGVGGDHNSGLGIFQRH